MTDPFAELRAPLVPVAPDPAFRAELRRRLERALALPRGVAPVPSSTPTGTPAAAPRPAAVPYLAVADARAAIDWYVRIFGARPAGDPIVMPDGRIGHAELELAGGLLYLADEHPAIGVTAPRPGEAAVSLMLPVDDADAVRARALDAGATGDREPYDGHGQRNAWIVDPFGHRWGLHSPLPEPAVELDVEPAARPYRHGDVGYVSLVVRDVARAANFYRDALGWAVDVAPDGSHARVDAAGPAIGINTGGDPDRVFCCFAVDDLDAARAAVTASGGRADAPQVRPQGRTADCTDPAGTAFALFEPAPGTGHGDDPSVVYLTFEMTDSEQARAFYGEVLGWRVRPGHVEDGWQVEDTFPMAGISGGHPRATVVPMWPVPDIASAVAAVRAAGGSATEPERQPYGITAECRDEQGLRFYLGQL